MLRSMLKRNLVYRVCSLHCHNYKTEPDKKTDKGGLKVWNNDCKNGDQKDNGPCRGGITKVKKCVEEVTIKIFVYFSSHKNSAHEKSAERRPFFSPDITGWWSWSTVVPSC